MPSFFTTSMTQLQYSSTVLHDVDQYQLWAGDVGWQLETAQLSRGPNQITFDHVALPELSVAHHRTTQAMYDVFAIPPRHIVFVICRAALPAVWCGRNLPPSLLAIHRPVRTYCARLPAGWDTYEFTVPEEMVERTELFPPAFFEKTTRLEQSFLPLVEPQTGLFLKRMDDYFQMVRTANGALAGAAFTNEFYDVVLHGLQKLIDAGLGAGPARILQHTRRPDLVGQAREFMMENLPCDLTADQIAQSLGVSYRVLNYAFHDNVGISPYQYFLTERLHAVRRELRCSDASIAEVCLSYGFSTPSRFARQYRRLFGELPSETRNGSRFRRTE
jgi:AraC family ethanolamine operon transcriptional activator